MPANRSLLESVARALVSNAHEISHLGTGGFACTFRIRDDDGEWALKIIDPGLSERERVDRELNALQRVASDGVVRFIEHGTHMYEDVDYCWIRMEFVEGRSLGAELASGVVFTASEAVQLVQRLVQSAASIWNAGTAHRDLSPNNIIIQSDGQPVIVDLGLARHVDDESFTALPTPGTPGWMSPEQVGSSPVHGDWRSDQFVIGALAYRLLTNVQPFYAPSLVDRWRAPAVQTPQPIRAIDPDIPVAAADVIERMLHKQPHRRYLQVTDLLADLQNAIAVLETSSVAATRRLHQTIRDRAGRLRHAGADSEGQRSLVRQRHPYSTDSLRREEGQAAHLRPSSTSAANAGRPGRRRRALADDQLGGQLDPV